MAQALGGTWGGAVLGGIILLAAILLLTRGQRAPHTESYMAARHPQAPWSTAAYHLPYWNPQSPNQYAAGGVWPDTLYSATRFWSPGFYSTSNWSWALRPGVGYTSRLPRAYWTENVDGRFLVNNNGGQAS